MCSGRYMSASIVGWYITYKGITGMWWVCHYLMDFEICKG